MIVFSSGFCFPEVWFFPQVRYFQFLVPKVSIQPNSFKYSSTVSESPHLIPETHRQRERALRTCNTVHRPADMFMLQLGWESRVGSNYMCLVLLRNPKLRSRSTRGPLGPKVEQAAARIPSQPQTHMVTAHPGFSHPSYSMNMPAGLCTMLQVLSARSPGRCVSGKR